MSWRASDWIYSHGELGIWTSTREKSAPPKSNTALRSALGRVPAPANGRSDPMRGHRDPQHLADPVVITGAVRNYAEIIDQEVTFRG
jgi:hypothetical protein